MATDVLTALRDVPDADLVALVKAFASHQREAGAELLAHLGELEARDLHLRAGHGSLFAYCRDALAMAEGDAYSHVEAARAARRFPAILDRLARGALHLTSVRLLAPYLTPENHEAVLEEARGKRRAQVEEIAARLWPRPDVPPSLRKLPPPRPGVATPPREMGPLPASPAALPTAPLTAPRPATGDITPLAPDRYRLQVTIGGQTLERLRLAKDMLRHAVPSGDDSQIIDRALAALLADLARKRFGATDEPRAARASAPGSRHIPAEVRRAVFLRDMGRCAYVAEGGRRCAERAFLEFHHLRPYAQGGEATAANIALRCRRHNAYESRAFLSPSLAREAPEAYGSLTMGRRRLSESVPDRCR